jgi:hypothetical protein
MFIRRVAGNSMSPILKSGDIVMGWKRPLRAGDIVIAQLNNAEVVKRVESYKGNKVYLVGDNRQESTDSRHYGPVAWRAILGTVMIHFARATKPPAVRKLYARRLALILTGAFIVFALLHLVRIDKLIPVIAAVFPGGAGAAEIFVACIVVAEVFALPFLLGLSISPLARFFSGLFVVLVPLAWTCLSIWALGNPNPLGEFSSYSHALSSLPIVLFNLVWLTASYWSLHVLSFDKVFQRLNKKS